MFEESLRNQKSSTAVAENTRNTHQNYQQEQRNTDTTSGLNKPQRNTQPKALDKLKGFREEFGTSRKDILNFRIATDIAGNDDFRVELCCQRLHTR